MWLYYIKVQFPLKKFWKCQFIMNLRTANLFLGFFKWRSLFKKRNAASDKIWWFHYLQMLVVILLPKRFSNGHIMKFIFTIWDSGMSLVKTKKFQKKKPFIKLFPIKQGCSLTWGTGWGWYPRGGPSRYGNVDVSEINDRCTLLYIVTA